MEKPGDEEPDRAAELNGLRIRQLTAMRRAAYRGRSHAIIAAAAAFAVAAQLGWMSVDLLRSARLGVRPIAYGILCLAALLGAIVFLRKALQLHREASHSLLSEPPTAPDFSTLSDGSQTVANLDSMRDRHDDRSPHEQAEGFIQPAPTAPSPRSASSDPPP
jgi:hypothetical protein